jgi:hypothetical protein
VSHFQLLVLIIASANAMAALFFFVRALAAARGTAAQADGQARRSSDEPTMGSSEEASPPEANGYTP